MPIPWLTVLQSLPWSELIANAPKVADGAKKLWKRVGRPAPDADPPAGDTPTPDARIARLEERLAEVHEQLLASSELIKNLAEQNALLVRQAEAVRRRLRVLQAGLAALGLLAGLALLHGYAG